MFDWAWGPQAAEISIHRRLAYFASMTTLLTVLKASDSALNHHLGSNFHQGLITPYLAPLLDPAMELLDEFSEQRHVDSELWVPMIRFLKLSFEVDEGGEPDACLRGRLDLTTDSILEGWPD